MSKYFYPLLPVLSSIPALIVTGVFLSATGYGIHLLYVDPEENAVAVLLVMIFGMAGVASLVATVGGIIGAVKARLRW